MQKRAEQLTEKQTEKKNIVVEKRKIAEKKTKIDNAEKKMKIDKFETKHMHTTDKENMKKKIKIVEIETFAVIDYH